MDFQLRMILPTSLFEAFKHPFVGPLIRPIVRLPVCGFLLARAGSARACHREPFGAIRSTQARSSAASTLIHPHFSIGVYANSRESPPGDSTLKCPTTGIVDCCARAASGHAVRPA